MCFPTQVTDENYDEHSMDLDLHYLRELIYWLDDLGWSYEVPNLHVGDWDALYELTRVVLSK